MFHCIDLYCPENSLYKEDMYLDVDTCDNPHGYYPVSQGQGEGCECLEGYVRDGLLCVELYACRCAVPDQYAVYIAVGRYCLA